MTLTIWSFCKTKKEETIEVCVNLTEVWLMLSLLYENVDCWLVSRHNISKLLTATTGQILNPNATKTIIYPSKKIKKKSKEKNTPE